MYCSLCTINHTLYMLILPQYTANMAKFMINKVHTWQSQVEIEHYSVAYFDRTTAFEAL